MSTRVRVGVVGVVGVVEVAMKVMMTSVVWMGRLVGLFGFLAAAQAYGQVPQLFPVQGLLSDSSGNRIQGNTSMTFRLYDSDVSNALPLYQETQTIDVDGGLFTAYLGAVTVLPMDFLSRPELWLGIQIGSDREMSPRFRIATAPYAGLAMQCGDARRLNGFTETSFAPATHSHPFASLTNIPAGLSDGDDDTTYSAGAGLTLANNTFSVAAVNSAMIIDGAVGTVDLASNAVTSVKIAQGAVNSTAIVDGAITTLDIANGAITQIKLASGSVGTAQIVSNSITSSLISDGTITGSDIAATTNLNIAGITADNISYRNRAARSVTVGESAFRGRLGTTQIQCCLGRGGAHISNGANDAMVAPVNIPLGATITGFTAFYVDEDPMNLVVQLLLHRLDFYEFPGQFASAGQDSAVRNGFVDIVDFTHTIPEHTWAIRVYASTGTGATLDPWPQGSTAPSLRVLSVVVHYTVDRPD